MCSRVELAELIPLGPCSTRLHTCDPTDDDATRLPGHSTPRAAKLSERQLQVWLRPHLSLSRLSRLSSYKATASHVCHPFTLILVGPGRGFDPHRLGSSERRPPRLDLRPHQRVARRSAPPAFGPYLRVRLSIGLHLFPYTRA